MARAPRPFSTIDENDSPRLLDWIARIGRAVTVMVGRVGAVAVLGGQTARTMVRSRWDWNEFIRQCFVLGNRSMPIVVLIGVFTGMVLALQFVVGLSRFGLQLYTGQIVGLALTRELGPVLTALMVAARVGSGIAAELGSMVVTEQVLAIEAMGANPIQKLVVPRVAATIVTTPLLTVIADALGVLGGMVITMLQTGVSANFYMQQIWRTVGIQDFSHGITKTVVFAAMISLISCQQGLAAYGGTEGVGRATTRAVVFGSVAVFIADFFLTKLFIAF